MGQNSINKEKINNETLQTDLNDTIEKDDYTITINKSGFMPGLRNLNKNSNKKPKKIFLGNLGKKNESINVSNLSSSMYLNKNKNKLDQSSFI